MTGWAVVNLLIYSELRQDRELWRRELGEKKCCKHAPRVQISVATIDETVVEKTRARELCAAGKRGGSTEELRK